MPEETSQQPPSSAQGSETPEINLPEESLKNYEITTMARDLKEEPSVRIAPPPEAPSDILPPSPLPRKDIIQGQEQPQKPIETLSLSSKENELPEENAFIIDTKPNEIKPDEVKPIVQEKPLESDKSSISEILSQMEESPRPSMKYFLAGFLAIALLGFGGFGIYWYFTRPTGPTPPVAVTPLPIPQATSTPPIVSSPPNPEPVPLAPPQFDSPLVAVNKTLPLELTKGETAQEFLATLKEAITQVSSQANEGDLIRIYLYRDGKKISLSDFQAMLKSKPLTASPYLEGDSYTLFYRQGAGTDVSFGLIARASDIANVKNNLSDMEENSPDILQALYQGYQVKEAPAKTSEKFTDNTYKNVSIRFINFGSSDIAIDYALYNKNLLLIAGSRKTMYALIDRLSLGL